MGLNTKTIEVTLNSKNIKWYEGKKYEIPKEKDKWNRLRIPKGTKILVEIEDLKNGSKVNVDCNCDACGKLLENIQWANYLNCVHIDGTYYCNLCSKNDNKKWISFEERCCTNLSKEEKENILGRWDYELNKCKPSEIPYSTTKKYWFKCPLGIHPSELKNINSFTSGSKGSMNCNACNSFAQWGINNFGEDFLEKYWSEKNIGTNPWEISHGTPNINIYLKCQKKDCKHEDYLITPNSFTNFTHQRGCPKCGFENKCGENGYQWQGGITELNHYLRKLITPWNKDSVKNSNYKCTISGGNFDVVHHLYGFELIVKETLRELDLPIYKTLSNYTFLQLEQIKNKCLELHYKYGLGVCLSDSTHKLFHSIYGNGGNTPEQFQEFQENIKNKIIKI